jgi:hypothetical protein
MVTTTFCTSGMVLAKVGIGYNTNLDGKAAAIVSSDFIIDLWIVEAEAYINALCRNDFVTNYSSMTSSGKKLLQDIASSYAAIQAISYDLSGFSSRAAAEDKMNLLREKVSNGIKILEQQKTQDFLGEA